MSKYFVVVKNSDGTFGIIGTKGVVRLYESVAAAQAPALDMLDHIHVFSIEKFEVPAE